MSRKIIYKCTYIYNDIPGYRDKTNIQHTHTQKEKKKKLQKNTKAFALVSVGGTWNLAKDLEYQSLGLHSRVSVRLRRAQKLSLLLAWKAK